MIPLTTTPDHTQIANALTRVEDRRCVVVGSAPLRTTTAIVHPGEYVICVNGAISSVAGVPDCWVLNSKPSRSHLHLMMLRQGKDRAVRHVIFMRGTIRATEEETLRRLAKLHATCESWSVIDKPIKRLFEETYCDRQDGIRPACSTGIFTAALALWSGAAHVRLTGFSWKPGYHYLRQGPMVRGHVDADQRALRALYARYGKRLSGDLIREAVAA